MVRNVVRLEELLADIYHQREQVEDEAHLPAFAMNLVLFDMADGGRNSRARGPRY